MKKYNVVSSISCPIEVTADEIIIRDGTLLFLTGPVASSRRIIKAYAPGSWTCVTEVEAASNPPLTNKERTFQY